MLVANALQQTTLIIFVPHSVLGLVYPGLQLMKAELKKSIASTGYKLPRREFLVQGSHVSQKVLTSDRDGGIRA